MEYGEGKITEDQELRTRSKSQMGRPRRSYAEAKIGQQGIRRGTRREKGKWTTKEKVDGYGKERRGGCWNQEQEKGNMDGRRQ